MLIFIPKNPNMVPIALVFDIFIEKYRAIPYTIILTTYPSKLNIIPQLLLTEVFTNEKSIFMFIEATAVPMASPNANFVSKPIKNIDAASHIKTIIIFSFIVWFLHSQALFNFFFIPFYRFYPLSFL